MECPRVQEHTMHLVSDKSGELTYIKEKQQDVVGWGVVLEQQWQILPRGADCLIDLFRLPELSAMSAVTGSLNT